MLLVASLEPREFRIWHRPDCALKTHVKVAYHHYLDKDYHWPVSSRRVIHECVTNAELAALEYNKKPPALLERIEPQYDGDTLWGVLDLIWDFANDHSFECTRRCKTHQPSLTDPGDCSCEIDDDISADFSRLHRELVFALNKSLGKREHPEEMYKSATKIRLLLKSAKTERYLRDVYYVPSMIKEALA